MRPTSLSASIVVSLFLGITTVFPASSNGGHVTEGKNPSITAGCKDMPGTLHVVFENSRTELVGAGSFPGTKKQILSLFYIRSDDEGLKWTAPTRISDIYDVVQRVPVKIVCDPKIGKEHLQELTPEMSRAYVTSHAQIALEENNVLDVVWADAPSIDSADIYFARSTDNGKTWSKPVDISNTPGVSSEPALVVDQEKMIHVVWCDTSTGEKNRDVYYSYSKDGGVHWGKDPLLPADNISQTPGSSSEPTISVDPTGIVQVAWSDTSSGERKPDIYYVRKEKGIWTKPEDLSNSQRISSHPKIVNSALAWSDNGAYLQFPDSAKKEKSADIWCLFSGDQHFNSMKPINISNTNGVASEPAIAEGKDHNVAVVWSDTLTGAERADIRFSFSNNNGSSFSASMNLSNSRVPSKNPDVAIIGKNACAIWEETEDGKSVLKTKLVNLTAEPRQ